MPRTPSQIKDPISAPAYLSRCIRGALLHHARDLGRMIRVPRRVQEAATAPLPWHLASLDQPLPSGQGSLLDQIADPQPMAEPAEPQDAAVAALLDQLPARQAAVIRLRHLQGISCRDAAQQLGISRMGVCREEQRGLAQLRRALAAPAAWGVRGDRLLWYRVPGGSGDGADRGAPARSPPGPFCAGDRVAPLGSGGLRPAAPLDHLPERF